MSPPKNKAIFLDRDGTIIEEKHYLSDPKQVEILPQTIEGLKQLQQAGYLLIIITNQSGIGRGYFTINDFLRVQKRVATVFQEQDITFDDFFYCPHHPENGIGQYKQDSPNRKPNPGMILKAIKKYNINPSLSYMIGDKECDIGAGQNANVHSIMLTSQKSAKKNPSHNLQKNARLEVFSNLNEAANFILKKEEN